MKLEAPEEVLSPPVSRARAKFSVPLLGGFGLYTSSQTVLRERHIKLDSHMRFRKTDPDEEYQIYFPSRLDLVYRMRVPLSPVSVLRGRGD